MKRKKIVKSFKVMVLSGLLVSAGSIVRGDTPLRIMPVGDSITRGTYFTGNTIANPLAGGYRKPLQDSLLAVGLDFEFVGELDYWAYGVDGVVDPQFFPNHHGLAGFSNTAILNGGVVPTPQEVLDAKGVTEISVPGIVEAISNNTPDVVLLMSGANGFNETTRDLLIRTICENFTGDLLVANITPQKEPRSGWEQVTSYNASLPATVATLKGEGHSIHFVDMYSALTDDDISADGVHPTLAGLAKIAETWSQALVPGIVSPSVDIFGDPAGGTIHPNGWFTPKEVIAGVGDPALSQNYNGIVFFQLPQNRIESADLTLTVELLYGSWPAANTAIDVWGLGYVSTPVLNNASKSWTLMADSDTQSLINTYPYNVSSTKIADNFVAVGGSAPLYSSWSLNAGQRANLVGFLNDLYLKGAQPGDYAVIRVNPDTSMIASEGTSIRFARGETPPPTPDSRPKLSVTLANEPAPTPPVIPILNYSHANDGTVFLAGYNSGYDLISGGLANPSVDGSGIAFVALPQQAMNQASLEFTVETSWNPATVANIDVWGLGYLPASPSSNDHTVAVNPPLPTLNKAWLNINDDDSRVLLNGSLPVKLADNIVTAGQTVVPGDVWMPSIDQQENIRIYLNGLYEHGAKPGDFAVIRMSMDASQAGDTIARGVRWSGSQRSNPERRAVLTGFYPATANYLMNPGFEAGIGGVPSDWTIDDRGFLGVQASVSVRSGSSSFKISVNGDQSGNTQNNLNITQSVSSPDFAGRLVTLSGYVRHDSVEPLVVGSVQKVELRMYWIGGALNNKWVTSTDAHNLLPTDVKDGYKAIYVSAVAPEDVTGIKAMVIFRSGTTTDPAITTGAAYVDDLSLTVFEEESAPAETLIILQ